MEKNQIVRIKYCDYADLCSECVRFSVSGMKIISGTAHRELAERIAQSVGIQLTNVTVNTFPDGESFVKINENIRGKDVFLIQPTCPPTNHNIMELCVMVDAARRASAGRITAVVPFFGYARQDRKAKGRDPISAKLVANMIEAAGADRVLTMDLHAAQIQGFFDIPVDNLLSNPIFVKYYMSKFEHPEEMVVVSPDVGGVKMARAYSDALGAELAIVAKHRVNATHVEAMNVIGDVEGRDAVLIDDMTETAGTLCAAANILKERGAQRVFACVSHGVLGDMARERISGSCIERVLTSDTVPMAYGPKVDCVSVGDLLGHAVQRIHDGESVSSLFDI